MFRSTIRILILIQMEVIEGVLPDKYRARNAIVDNLQKKVNVYCSQVQMNNVNIKK